MRRRGAAFACDMIEPFLRFVKQRVAFLFGEKCFRVRVAAAFNDARRMFDVQHLVIEDVFDKPLGNIWRVQRLADDDGVEGAIMMAENAARASLRPGERGLFQFVVKITTVEAREQAVEIMIAAARGGDPLAPATAPCDVGGALDVRRESVIAIDAFMPLRSLATQERRDEHKCERALDIERRVAKDVGEADVDASRAASNRVVETGVRVEANLDFRRRLMALKLPEGVREKRAEMWLRG